MENYKPHSEIAIVSLGRKDVVAQLPFLTISGRIPGFIKSRDLFVGALVNGINPSYLVYHVGYTKLYLRAGQIDAPENKRKQVLQGILEIQKCFRGHQARGYFCELKNGMTTLQSCTASWLVTRDASHVNRSKTYPENAKPRRKSFMEIIPEVKDLSKEPVQNLVSALAGLQRRVDKADAIVEQLWSKRKKKKPLL
ncbi:hypothetical protein JHK85_024961 [Glycine max]|nr:hypothetical protein JHK85_024961 [Glycine max]